MMQTISSEVDTQWDSTSRMDPIERPCNVTWAKPQSMARCFPGLPYPRRSTGRFYETPSTVYDIYWDNVISYQLKEPFEAASLLSLVKN